LTTVTNRRLDTLRDMEISPRAMGGLTIPAENYLVPPYRLPEIIRL
jgi:hypothetical protein